MWLQVGVTCSFNDVSNSRVEVRPDRDYLKQQLRAVEARVIAIQEKKRKLDQRMAVLTEGLKVGGPAVAAHLKTLTFDGSIDPLPTPCSFSRPVVACRANASSF